jgi:excisionase family DNA binding protein
MERSVMTMEEVAKYLSFSVKHVQRLVANGEIPHSRVGGQLRFLKSRIDEWIRAHEMKPSVFCAGCNRVFTEPFLPPAKKKEDLKNPEYVRVKQYMDGGEYFCPACFTKTKACPLCGEHFLPDLQGRNQEICFPCATLEAERKK